MDRTLKRAKRPSKRRNHRNVAALLAGRDDLPLLRARRLGPPVRLRPTPLLQEGGGVADRVKQGVDVLICRPRLVQTGLDLVDFPTICWAETEFSVFQSTGKGRFSWAVDLNAIGSE